MLRKTTSPCFDTYPHCCCSSFCSVLCSCIFLKFCSIASKPAKILDEPTNHLDMETIDALVEALSDFRGGLVCVSHDQFFITKICTQLVVVGDGLVTPFPGDFVDYKKHTLAKTAKRVAESVKSISTVNN